MKRLRELDLLRVFGTLIIVLHHLPDYVGNFYDLRYFGLRGNFSYINVVNTYIGLGIFTFISGVALRHAYPRVQRTVPFLWKRWLRLFPLYWLALPMFALTGIKSDVWGWAVHILGLQIALAPRLVRPLPTLWFVGLVAMLYPFYALVARRERDGRAVVALSLMAFAVAFVVRLAVGVVEYRFFVYLPVFVAGVLWRQSGAYRRHRLRPVAVIVAALAFVLSVFAFRYARQSEISGEVGESFIAEAQWGDIVSTFVFSNLMTLSFLYLAYPTARAVMKHHLVARSAGWKRVITVGSWASYGVYLFHRPVLAALAAALNAPSIGQPWRLVVVALPGALLIPVLACAVQYLQDRLVFRLGRWGRKG